MTVRKRFSKTDSISQETDKIFYTYLYLSKIICKKLKRKIFYVHKYQEKKLPHRYVFINFEFDSYVNITNIISNYVRSSAPHGNAKTLKKRYLQTCQSTIVNWERPQLVWNLYQRRKTSEYYSVARLMLLKLAKIIIKLRMVEDNIHLKFFSLFQVALIY